MGAEVLTQPPSITTPRPRRLFPLWTFALVAGILMTLGATYSVQDVNDYHCYALAFWRGAHATAALAADSCLMPLSSLAQTPFHTMPTEYGPLAMLTFLPPLLVPADWYNLAFYVEMALVAVVVAFVLDRHGAVWAGHAWLIFALLGGWLLTAGRFDITPAACVLVAVLCARAGRLRWAYVALAIGVLLKLYPLALLPLLLIESWRARGHEPFWRGPALFVGIVAAVESIAAALASGSPLTPLTYMSARCVQIESFPATFASLWAVGAHLLPAYPYDFNSTCIDVSGIGVAQAAALLLGLVGYGLALSLYWLRRVSLGVAALLLIASLIVASKVFSPQYLVWLSPLVALEYGADAAALLCWSVVCALTTLCFPYSYNGALGDPLNQSPFTMIQLTSGARNLLLLALGVVVYARRMASWVKEMA